VVVKKEIDTQGAKNKGQESRDVADETGSDFEGKKNGDEENAGEIGGFGHTGEKPGTAILSPDGEKGSSEVLCNVKLGMKIVPAGEESAGFVV